jgi:hypothetical protein
MDQQQMSLSDQKHQQQQKHQQLPDIFTLQEIENVVESEEFVNDLIDGLEDGFIALQGGDFFAAPIQTLGLPPFPFVDGDVDGYAAQTCIKTGYFKGTKCIGASHMNWIGHPRINTLGTVLSLYAVSFLHFESCIL